MIIAPILIVECVALLFLLLCSAFFSSSETALFSLDSLEVGKLREKHPQAAARIELMLDTPTQLLSTILIGNTLVNVAAAALGFVVVRNLGIPYPETVAICSMTALLLIVGEVAPKRLAMTCAPALAASYSGILVCLIRIMTPARVMLEWASRAFLSNLKPTDKTLTEEEFRTVVEVGEEEGVLDEEERTMMDGIIRLEETQASDVMTPRVDIVGIDLTDLPREREDVARSVRFRYLPLYRETTDHIEGFLDVPHFLLSGGKDLKAATIPPFFVPETAPLDTLLTTFQKERRRVAVVADEFGGTAGLITLGDILEEIAADVDNEYGEETFTIQQMGERIWLVDGSMSLEDVNYELDMDLEAEGADRIAGWVTAQAEHIPKIGEVVEAQGCRATVRRLRRHRVLLVLLEKLNLPDKEQKEES